MWITPLVTATSTLKLNKCISIIVFESKSKANLYLNFILILN